MTNTKKKIVGGLNQPSPVGNRVKQRDHSDPDMPLANRVRVRDHPDPDMPSTQARMGRIVPNFQATTTEAQYIYLDYKKPFHVVLYIILERYFGTKICYDNR